MTFFRSYRALRGLCVLLSLTPADATAPHRRRTPLLPLTTLPTTYQRTDSIQRCDPSEPFYLNLLTMSTTAQQLSPYEIARLENIERNRLQLVALGLDKARSAVSLKPRVKRKRPKAVAAKQAKRAKTTSSSGVSSTNIVQGKRTSRRLNKKQPLSSGLSHDWEDPDEEEEEAIETRWPQRPDKDIYGSLPGIQIGFKFDTRLAACQAGVHRATVAGIVGKEDHGGCYSIVLNGGYADDVDEGSHLTYTGSGGRSLKGTAANPKNLRTGPHTKHQTMDGHEGRNNRALAKSIDTKQPVRVVRGYKLDSKYAPLGIDYGGDANYRYDGLYRVVKMWTSSGIDHPFNVFKFALVRLPNQSSLPIRPDLLNEE